MSVQRWVAEGVNSDDIWYWAGAHILKFLIEGTLSGILGAIVMAVVYGLTAAVGPSLPALLSLSTGIPYGVLSSVAGWALVSGLILRYLIWCRLDERIET